MTRHGKVTYSPRHAAAPAPSASGRETAVFTGRLLVTGLVMAACTTILSLFTWTLLPYAVGWSPSVVLTGSMRPSIEPGDIVVTAEVKPEALLVGHVIRFVDPARPSRHLLHRITRINDDGTFVTRGDANRNEDSTPVPRKNVTGVARLRVPIIGLPVVWLHEGEYLPLGLTALGVLATLQLASGLRNVMTADEEPVQQVVAGAGPAADGSTGDDSTPCTGSDVGRITGPPVPVLPVPVLPVPVLPVPDGLSVAEPVAEQDWYALGESVADPEPVVAAAV